MTPRILAGREHDDEGGPRVLFVSARRGPGEERAALDRLRRLWAYDVRHVPLAELGVADLDADVIWIHAADAVPKLSRELAQALRDHVRAGGGLLLSLLATPLVVPLGLEQMGPGHVGPRSARPKGGSGFGLQAWGGHPLLHGLGRAVDTSDGSGGVRSEAVYVRPRWPVRGRVVAVERSGIEVDADRAVVWEYAPDAGRVLCIGAHFHFSSPDELDPERDRLLSNALALLGRRAPRAPALWPHPYAELPPVGTAEVPLAALGPPLPEIASASTLTSVARHDEPFTLAGRRAGVVGGERGGVREIWVHPLRILSGGVAMRVDEEIPDVRSVEVSPEQIVRHLQTRTRFIEERIFVPLHEPGVVIEYRYRRLGKARADVEPPMLDLQLPLALQLGWPMPDDALRPLRAARHAAAGVAACAVLGSDDHFRALVQAEGQVELHAAPNGTGILVTVAASLSEPLRLTILGTTGGRPALARIVKTFARGSVRGLATRRAEWAAALQDEHLALRSPSAALDTALEWAKVRLASALASTAGVGAGVLRGWTGAGRERPAYAGERACWSIVGLLAIGCFDEAKSAIELLGAFQDPGGRIPAEATPSGGARYAPGDATAPWLWALAEYVAWTGDLRTLGQLWPSAGRAMAAVERRSAAHATAREVLAATAEAGPPRELHELTTLVAAGEGMARLAALLKDAGVERRASSVATRAAARVATLVDDVRTGDPDAPPRERALPEIAAAVALGAVMPDPAGPLLDTLAAPRYSGPHGVRLVPRGHPGYRPAEHDAGAVRPFLTGTLALAEFLAHRQEAGYRHLLANAALCYERAQGAFQDALHGEGASPIGGVVDDPAVAAMVVLPVARGVLGAIPDAPTRSLRLTPHWPREWTRASIGPLRVGAAELHVDAAEGCLIDGLPYDGVRYRLRVRPPGGLTVTLEHAVGGRSFLRVLINGAEVEFERCGTDGCPHVRVVVAPVAELEVQFVGHRLDGDATGSPDVG